jgi:hypothetical protein
MCGLLDDIFIHAVRVWYEYVYNFIVTSGYNKFF